MQGFYWLVQGILAGCPLPGGRRPRAGGISSSLENDLAWLREQGISALLSLTEEPLPAEVLIRQGIEGLHLPVVDLTPPTPAQLTYALEFIDWHRAHSQAVAVHCLMGQGRTGTVLAAYLIRAGATPEQALAELRAVCPGAVENDAQVRALAAYAARRDWIM
jgi:atypical dual specificity phosphatase